MCFCKFVKFVLSKEFTSPNDVLGKILWLMSARWQDEIGRKVAGRYGFRVCTMKQRTEVQRCAKKIIRAILVWYKRWISGKIKEKKVDQTRKPTEFQEKERMLERAGSTQVIVERVCVDG